MPRTVLARDEDVGIGDGDLVDDLPYVCHSLTRAPEHGRGIVAGGAGALFAGVGAERGQTVGVAQRGDEFLVVPRLDHKIHGSHLHRLHRKVDVGIGGEQHHFGRRVAVEDLLQPVYALVAGVDAGVEVHVEQHDVGTLRTHCRDERIG